MAQEKKEKDKRRRRKEGGGEESIYQLVVAFDSNKLEAGTERNRTPFNRGKCKREKRKENHSLIHRHETSVSRIVHVKIILDIYLKMNSQK